MENIRITSGIYRGRTISSPNSKLTHPMGSREKIALFNMISEKIPNAVVLDAYAGSRALGIEAISRGAKEVIFVEKSPKIAQTIRENLNKLALKAEILTQDVKKLKTNHRFDIILTDPPYDNFDQNAISNLTEYLKDGGILVLSHPSSAPVINGLNLTKTHQYSKANITIYQK